MIFQTRPVKIHTLGERLVELRNHLGISVNEVSRLAKIPQKYLVALEQGDYSNLPAPVYIKGFLKTLSYIYRVDDKSFIDLFESESGLSNNIKNTQIRPGKIEMPKFIVNSRTLAVGLVGIGCFFSIAYLYFQISSVNRPPKLQIFSPAENGIAENSLMLVSGQTEPGATVFLNNQSIAVDVGGKFRENLSLAPGTNVLNIKAVNKFGKETILSRSMIVEAKKIAGAFDSQGTPFLQEINDIVELSVSVGPQASWMSIMIDGHEDFTGTMLAGSSRLIRGENIRISTANAGSTKLTLNGRDLGVMGKENEIIKDVVFSK